MTTFPVTEPAVQRAAGAIAIVILRGGDHAEAARAALEAAQPSPAMAEREARMLLTEKGILPEVHTAFGDPLRPLCGNPEGFGSGGYATTSTLEITCQDCLDRHGFTEDEFAKFERWAQEGPPADQCIPSAQVIAEAGL